MRWPIFDFISEAREHALKNHSSTHQSHSEARHSNLQDWLSWLETLHPKKIDLGLDRTRCVANRLGLSTKPSNDATLITVAGTNGKGSFVASALALLKQSGARVGTYTSPHILRYNERIQIDGVPVSDAEICGAFEKIDCARMSAPKSDSDLGAEISLSYFEFATLAALILFEQNSLDIWILEVGLGGRLDATNIMDADIAVITSIAMDHESFLGSTREAIAVEKAGIIRSGAAVICSDFNPPKTLSTIISEKTEDVFFIGKDFSFDLDKNSHKKTRCRFAISKDQTLHLEQRPNLPMASVAAALKVYELLINRHGVSRSSIDELVLTIQNLGLAGRFESHTYHSVPVLFDVAHNPAATQHLSQRLHAEGYGNSPGNRQISCLVAMMEDKDVTSSISPMAEILSHWFCTEIPNFPRSMSSDVFAENVATMLGCTPVCEDDCDQNSEQLLAENRVFVDKDFADALNKAVNFAKKSGQALLIFGSFYTVAEAKKVFGMTDCRFKNS